MKIGIVGDLILSDKLVIDKGLRDLLNSTDINIANLEAPFIKEKFKTKLKSGLHQLTEDCSILHDLNISVVSLANNHIGDFGLEGIQYTRQVLHDNQIHFFGAGKNLEEACTPAELTINNLKIACWGFMMRFFSSRYFATMDHHGVPQLRKKLIMKSLHESDAEIKIVYNHWNQEFEDYPEPVCKSLAEEISPYCNLIIGSHSHCLQGIQTFHQNLILYSMGNFSIPVQKYYGVTMREYPEISRNSMIITVSINQDQIQYQVHPIILTQLGNQIHLPDQGKKRTIEEHVQTISKPLEFDYHSYRKFYNKNKRRKLRLTLHRNERMNDFIIFLSKIMYYSLHFLEKSLAYTLARVGLLSFVKRRIAKTISYFQSIR